MSFEGEIGEIDLVQRLVELGREHFTGAIRFEQDGIIKIVYFKGGDVLSASTNDRADAVDEILLRASKVSKEHVKQALSKRKENESLGDALLNLGFITRKELTWGRRIQVIGILRSVRAWTHGAYAIVADYLPKREEGTLFPLQQVLIEMFVTEQDRQPFERALDGGSAVLEKSADFDEAFPRLGLNEDAAQIAAIIDGRRTAAEIAAATGKDIFNTYKLLEALRALGLLQKLETKAEVKDETSFESVGVADASEAWSSGKMPAFELEPEPPVEPGMESAPPPAAAVPAPNPAEVQWGFDEAQVEAANRPTAAAPPSKPRMTTQTQTRRTPPQFARPAAKPARNFPVFGLIVLLIVVAAGFGAWYYWKNMKSSAVQSPVAVQRKPPPVIHPTVPAPQPAAPAPAPAPVSPTPQPAITASVPVRPVPAPVPVPVPKPAPAPMPAASNDQFTIQVELVCQQASLNKATAIGGGKVWSAPIAYRGQSCHRVFWGRYPTRDAAEAAVAQIPAELRGSKPVVVSIPKT